MIAKGRHARGSKKRSAKLSEADVLAIRAEVSLTPKQMAEKYNISLSRIYLIRMGKSWAHLLETRAG
jgi:DNA-binding transcriptional regulator YiaG